jgi:hypothetical protein
MNCPNCDKKICSNTIVHDGGSLLCEHCNIKFHFCINNNVKYGSPGPSMCRLCMGIKKCPNCNKKICSAIIVNDGGSILCEHCKITFHICLNNIIKYGSPGPSICTFCQVAQILNE